MLSIGNAPSVIPSPPSGQLQPSLGPVLPPSPGFWTQGLEGITSSFTLKAKRVIDCVSYLLSVVQVVFFRVMCSPNIAIAQVPFSNRIAWFTGQLPELRREVEEIRKTVVEIEWEGEGRLKLLQGRVKNDLKELIRMEGIARQWFSTGETPLDVCSCLRDYQEIERQLQACEVLVGSLEQQLPSFARTMDREKKRILECAQEWKDLEGSLSLGSSTFLSGLKRLLSLHRNISSALYTLHPFQSSAKILDSGAAARTDHLIEEYTMVQSGCMTGVFGFEKLEYGLREIIFLLTKEGTLPRPLLDELMQGIGDLEEIGRLYHGPKSSSLWELRHLIRTLNVPATVAEAERRKPLPLQNVGNSCYMNSVFQLLTAIPDIREHCLRPLIPRIGQEASGRVLRAFARVIEKKNKETSAPVGCVEYFLSAFYSKGAVQPITADTPSLGSAKSKNADSWSYSMTSSSQWNIPSVSYEPWNSSPLVAERESWRSHGSSFSPERELRDAIFEHPATLLPLNRRWGQHDASELLVFLSDQFFSDFTGMKWQKRIHADHLFPGLELVASPELVNCLPIALAEGLQSGAEVQEGSQKALVSQTQGKTPPLLLMDLIKREFSPRQQSDSGFMFDPHAEGVRVVDAEQAAQSRQRVKQQPGQYTELWRWIELPQVLVLQLKRFTVKQSMRTGDYYSVKLNDPVELPADGIVDLTPYGASSSDASQMNARYKIKGYVVHSGTPGGGHYIACVEREGKYYQCDDSFVREISEQVFFGRKDAYLVMGERLLDTPSDLGERLLNAPSAAPAMIAVV